MHTWTLWYPKAAATGVLISRARIDPTNAVLVHASGDIVTVEVHDESGKLIAFGQDLPRTQASPMAIYRRDENRITREDLWPTDANLGATVILPGGEAAILKAWWHAPDRKEWRWQIELYNSLR
jgi:hypothetical protein